ncbi:MAG: RNA polymerase sigma factor [candidate division WOR-3 bacterium]
MSEKEKELIEKAKEGDEKSFEVLMEENYQRVFNLAFRLLRNEDDAYELTSDTFLRAYQSLGKFRGASSFYTYLYRICLNLGINRIKKKKILTVPVKDKEIPGVNGPIEVYQNKRLKEAIENALRHLSPRERVVFLLRHNEDRTIKEITQLLDIKEGTVKATYFHAIKKLQEFLREYL